MKLPATDLGTGSHLGGLCGSISKSKLNASISLQYASLISLAVAILLKLDNKIAAKKSKRLLHTFSKQFVIFYTYLQINECIKRSKIQKILVFYIIGYSLRNWCGLNLQHYPSKCILENKYTPHPLIF